MNDLAVLADRYELADVLGRGGMADVYRATDRVLARDVAVKLLRDTAQSETDRRRFTAEARTLAGLNHTGVVMILDAGISTEQPFLVMELVEGPTLGQACAAGILSPARAASVGVQLAEALAYAHDQGIIHRDVKPGNVLIGTDDRVKLADFGIARLIGETVSHTKTGTAVGTAAYLSPEQVKGQEITPATDVYSLGLVLLEALTGERAYPGTPTESALARLSRQPSIPEELPEGWRKLLHAMTSLEPRARPHPLEVAERLRAQADWPLPAGDAVPGERGTNRPAPTDGGAATLVLTQARETPTAWVPTTAAATTVSGQRGSRIDRAGDWLAGQLRAGLDTIKSMSPSQRGLAAALLALVAFVIVVALVARGSTPEEDPIPRDVPTDLEQPLRDLHEAVNGGG
jgi:eukaryotic-like serine/threonine-protein kinase